MEMTSLWKPQNGSHRDLEISLRTRDSHIPTARTLSLRKKQKRSDHLSNGSGQITCQQQKPRNRSRGQKPSTFAKKTRIVGTRAGCFRPEWCQSTECPYRRVRIGYNGLQPAHRRSTDDLSSRH